MKKQYYWLVKDCESRSLCEISKFDNYKEALIAGKRQYDYLTEKERSITALYIDKAPEDGNSGYYDESFAIPKKTFIEYQYRK